jgi:hypothetical protein
MPPAHEVGWLFFRRTRNNEAVLYKSKRGATCANDGFPVENSEIAVGGSLGKRSRGTEYVTKCIRPPSGKTSATHSVFHRVARKLMLPTWI